MNQFFQWLSSLFQGAQLWVIVMPWERGLRVRLGQWTRQLEPGWHWRLPFLDHVRVVNTRVRIASVPCSTVTTLDGKTVTVAGAVAFKIEDPLQVLLTIQQPESAVSALAQAAFTRYIVAAKSTDLSIGELEAYALAQLEQAAVRGMKYEFVQVVDFAIVRTYRLLQEQWRPQTEVTNLDGEKR